MNPSFSNFSSILSGLYKALTVANQAIPLYKQISPTVRNARNAFSIIKELNKSTNKNNQMKIENASVQKKELVLNNPVFFQ